MHFRNTQKKKIFRFVTPFQKETIQKKKEKKTEKTLVTSDNSNTDSARAIMMLKRQKQNEHGNAIVGQCRSHVNKAIYGIELY